MSAVVVAVGQRAGGAHCARAQDGSTGRAGGAVARGARGARCRILRRFLFLLAQLRDGPARQHRGESAGARSAR